MLAPLLLLFTAPVQAQDGLHLEQLQPSPLATGILGRPTTRVLDHNQWTVGLWSHGVQRPLSYFPEESESFQSVVPGSILAEAEAALGLFDRGQLAIAVPLAWNVGEPSVVLSDRGVSEIQGVALEDMRVSAHASLRRVLGARPGDGRLTGVDAALGLVAWLPTGDEAGFHGEGSLRAEPQLIVDLATRYGLRATADVGYHIRPPTEVLGYVHDDAVRWGVGVSTPVGPSWLEAMASVGGSSGLKGGAGAPDDPVEALLGVRVQAGPWTAQLAGGGGLTNSVGSPSARVGAGVSWTRQAAEGAASGGRSLEWWPNGDRDEDGVPDSDDVCPFEPELGNEIRDGDGCPEDPALLAMAGADSGDSLGPDSADTDEDGVPAWGDRCPDEAEDVDGFEDDDGCPDPDNDGDGVLDAADACPLEAETVDGFEDADGCPDLPPDAIKAVSGVVKGITFASGSDRLRRQSEPVLTQVLDVLQDNPDLHVQIVGHTDDVGDRELNVDLSRRRAESVQKWLVDRGIAAERLSTKGYGPDRPIVPNDTEVNRQENRRVELSYDSAKESP